MILPSFIRKNRGFSPLDVSGLVEWFDFCRPSKRVLLAPREISNVTINDAADEASITCNSPHGLIGDNTGFIPTYDSVVLSGLTGDVAGLNGTHDVIASVDSNIFKVSTSLADADVDFGANEAFVTDVVPKVKKLKGMSNNFTFVSINNNYCPYEHTDGIRFIKRNSGQPVPRFEIEESWSTVAQPLTVVFSFKDMVSSQPFGSYSYASFLNGVGLVTTATNVHRFFYSAGTYRQSSGNNVTLNSINLFAARLNGASSRAWKNGGTAIITTNPGTGGISTTWYFPDSGLGYSGSFEMYDIALYSGSLSNANIDLIGNYFSAKVSGPAWSNVS